MQAKNFNIKFLRSHRSNPNHTLVSKIIDVRPFGLPDNEITQVARITHVTVLNFLKMNIFLSSHRRYTNHTGCLY